MYTKKVYKARDMFKWTRFETLLFLIIILIVVSLFFFLDFRW